VSSAFYLTLLIGPVVPAPAPQPVMDAITGVQVTTTAGQRSGFQLTFAVSKDSPLQQALLPAGYFDPAVRVIVVATVGGVPNVLSDGVITRQELAPSNDPGKSTLTVTGEDLTVLMEFMEVKLPFPGLPLAAIVELILAKYAVFGIVPVVIPPLFLDVPNPLERFATQSGTDLDYVKAIAEDAGYVFYLDPGPAPGMNLGYFGPEIRIGVPQPALSVDMDGQTNVESLSFSLDGLAKTMPIVLVQIPEVKVSIPIPIPDVSILRPPLAARPSMPLKVRFLDGTAKLNPIQAILFGLAKAGQSSDSVTGSGSLDVLRYGRPLKARGLVGVRGAGLAYDGLYYVKSVTHDIKRGQYKQNFSLAREGLISLLPRVPV